MLQDLKSSMVSSKKPYPFQCLKVFPKTPSELPQAILDHAYDSDDVAVSVELDALKYIADNHIPLRSNSRLLTQKAKEFKSGDAESEVWNKLKFLVNGDGGSTLILLWLQEILGVYLEAGCGAHLVNESGQKHQHIQNTSAFFLRPIEFQVFLVCYWTTKNVTFPRAFSGMCIDEKH